MKQIKGFLDGVAFFNGFTLSEKRALLEVCTRQNAFLKYEQQEHIIQEGELDQAVYVILQGRAIVTKQGLSGVVITELKPGSLFGEISLIQNRARTTNVTANGTTIVLKLDIITIEMLPPPCKKNSRTS